MDRIRPTRRPEGRPVQFQRWQELLFLHWPVPVEILRPLVPERLSVDAFEGRAYVGLVPFTMRDVRPVWAPAVRGLSHFHETNVRTYVHLDGEEPGVWFFSLDAANRIAVWIARTFWRLPYHNARMSLETRDGLVRYETERSDPPPLPARASVRYRVDGPVTPAVPGTLEHFLAERYVLYAKGRKDVLLRGRVHHAPYPLQRVRVEAWDETLLAAAGIPRPDGEPLAHYAKGVDVDVFALEKVGSASGG